MRWQVTDAEAHAAWAVDMLRRGGLGVSLVTDDPLPDAASAVAVAYVERLGTRLEGWLPVPSEVGWKWRQASGQGLGRLHAFFESCGSRPPARVLALRRKVETRLRDHRKDLEAIWTDEAALAALPHGVRAVWRARRDQVLPRLEQGQLTLDEVELTLLLGAHKARRWPGLACPWFGRFDAVEVEIELSTLSRGVLALAAATQ